MQHDYVLKKLNLDLLPNPRVGGLRPKYLLPCCCILDSLHFDMQHDHVLKILPTDPILSVGGGGGGGLCEQNIYYQVAAFVIIFNLICNMTMV